MPEVTQPAEKVVETTGTVKFGINQITKPTPLWVKWIFRVEFILNKAFLMWVASTSMSIPNIKSLVLTATLIDFVIWGLGKFVGITKDEMEKAAGTE